MSAGEKVEYYSLQLQNVGEEVTEWTRDLTLNVNVDLGEKLALDDPSVVDSYRGEECTVYGWLYNDSVAYTDSAGRPRTKTVQKLKVNSIEF